MNKLNLAPLCTIQDLENITKYAKQGQTWDCVCALMGYLPKVYAEQCPNIKAAKEAYDLGALLYKAELQGYAITHCEGGVTVENYKTFIELMKRTGLAYTPAVTVNDKGEQITEIKAICIKEDEPIKESTKDE